MIIMKLFRIISRNVRDAGRNIIRNGSLSIASISCITITLVIVAISILSSYNIDHLTKLIKQEFTIYIYLEKEVNEKEIKDITSQIKKMSNVDSCQFRSKEDEAKLLTDSSETLAPIISRWTEDENPLHDIFLVKVKDIELMNKTAKQLESLEGVDFVRYGEEIIAQLLPVFRMVEKALLVVVLLLMFVTAFLITNTIKLTIFARKKEVEIKRLVGASNINIELSFIIEGLLLGILGAIIPIVMVIYGYPSLYKYFDGHLLSSFIRLINPDPIIYILALIILGLGIIVGMIGSFTAVRKYLKI